MGPVSETGRTSAGKRTKVLLATTVVLVLGLVTGVLYAFGLPPFKKVGTIEAADVCESLGDATSAAEALKQVVPEESSYSFQESSPIVRIGEVDMNLDLACFVYGSDDQLLSARTRAMTYTNTDHWVKERVGQLVPMSTLTPFSAGDRAVASDKVAAIYLPCRKHAMTDHLSVVIWLKKQGDASASLVRDGLIDLAKGMAAYAHTQARCDAPAKL
ncbi:hypothetical protein GCM10010512_49320 [Streptomyces thermoviolaceus subsp. thermoviolaceus]|nr:hypothetical protein GCM10010512_49320 [Streptomyces thermoviolaceus subsp. thermoviolaceus]